VSWVGSRTIESFRTMDLNTLSAPGLMLSCHSRYEHIFHSIWLISRSANMPWPAMHQDLLESVDSR
jgi:hypothetical protein